MTCSSRDEQDSASSCNRSSVAATSLLRHWRYKEQKVKEVADKFGGERRRRRNALYEYARDSEWERWQPKDKNQQKHRERERVIEGKEKGDIRKNRWASLAGRLKKAERERAIKTKLRRSTEVEGLGLALSLIYSDWDCCTCPFVFFTPPLFLPFCFLF